MSYELIIKKEPDYLHVQVIGIRTLATVIDMARDVVAACDEHGYRKALVDVREMIGRLEFHESYQIGTKDLQKLRRAGRKTQVSIIDREENRPRFEFLETVARNRLFNIRIFSNDDEAVNWLLEYSDSPGE